MIFPSFTSLLRFVRYRFQIILAFEYISNALSNAYQMFFYFINGELNFLTHLMKFIAMKIIIRIWIFETKFTLDSVILAERKILKSKLILDICSGVRNSTRIVWQ